MFPTQEAKSRSFVQLGNFYFYLKKKKKQVSKQDDYQNDFLKKLQWRSVRRRYRKLNPIRNEQLSRIFLVVCCHVTFASSIRTEVKMVSYNNAKMVDESHDK